MRDLIHKLLTEIEVPPPGMVRVGFDDGDVRYVTELAASCIQNEKARRGKNKYGPKRRKFCKRGHPMTGPKANVREYTYAKYKHRSCYHCVIERMAKARAEKKKPKTLAEWAAKARKAAA
jgi:hypothetical protein